MRRIDRGLWRRLHDELIDAGDARAVLDGWTAATAGLLDVLSPLRHRESPQVGDDGEAAAWYREGLFALYALSRVSDLLIERGCPAGGTGGRTLDRAALSVHERFFGRVGLERVRHGEAFSPFHHEIFAVSVDESAGAVTVEDVLWPGFRFGDLLFCRAGVRVRAPSRLLDAGTATTSTLYFTDRRDPRPSDDLSHGWGSNSQWRTRFHRFYEDSAGLHLNWDGEKYIGEGFVAPEDDANGGLTVPQRRELLLHRCFVTAPMPAGESDHYPYDDRVSLRAGAWPLDPGDVLPDPVNG
ncbi:hypothetical protein [Spirillospora sp. NPDC029432]|uniref:hypothetical protein n=1 Tax=Spirillospora sp. NPDC029432 TaxID=3154599 RepID=UPI003456BB35